MSPHPMPDLPPVLNDLLTSAECAQIDQTLLPTRDRFSIRLTIYCWRYLQQISAGLGVAIAQLQPQHITTWMQQDPKVCTQPKAIQTLWPGLAISSSPPKHH